MYNDNYKSYSEYYFKKIKERYPNSTDDEIINLIGDLENFYSSLPILHATSIDNIDSILNEGLKAFNRRREKNLSGSAIFGIDFQFGLNNCVFANLGKIPIYGPDDKRVTLVLNDDVCTEDNFFTFIDLALIYHFGGNDINATRERQRIVQQYQKGCLPLDKLWNILAMNALASKREISEKDYFPFAIEPDFIHQNGGIPEIKIKDAVSKEQIMGFVVEGNNAEKLKRELEEKGISSEFILEIDPNEDKYKQLIDFKRKILMMNGKEMYVSKSNQQNKL